MDETGEQGKQDMDRQRGSRMQEKICAQRRAEHVRSRPKGQLEITYKSAASSRLKSVLLRTCWDLPERQRSSVS